MTSYIQRKRLGRFLDPALAVVLFVAWSTEYLTRKHHPGPVPVNLLLLACATAPIAWRRRAPLASACVVMSMAVIIAAILNNVVSWVAPLYILFIPPYTVAAFESRNRALIGLAAMIAGVWAITSFSSANFGDYLFTGGAVSAAWVAGRALRARRLLAVELRRKAERIASERDTRMRLAIADERTRIARELHALVANSVSAMVVQTEAAERLLDRDSVGADRAMAAVEDTGREALAEMRRILGVLRHPGEKAELAPQPGVGQLHSLVERARGPRRHVGLDVRGEPGPLPASVDMCVYRVLEDALVDAYDAEVTLRFAEHDVELDIACAGGSTSAWPTLAMRERCEMCGGEIEAEHADDGQTVLRARLPRAIEAVLL